MNSGRSKLWSKDELLLAFYLYCQTPFGQIHRNNKRIIAFSKQIGRTPSAVSWKLVNFAHLDKTLHQQGASNCSKLDRELWEEFWENPEQVIQQSSELWQSYDNRTTVESLSTTIRKTGEDRVTVTKRRVNQSFFRDMILSAYNNQCCITGLPIPNLLVASHILPWSEYPKERLMPTNGLCLSGTYDKAFDRHLISLDEEYRLILSRRVSEFGSAEAINQYFYKIEGKQIQLPSRFKPSQEFLSVHRSHLTV